MSKGKRSLIWLTVRHVIVAGSVFVALYIDLVAGIASMIAVGLAWYEAFTAGVNSFCNFVFRRAEERKVDLNATLGITKPS